MGYCMGYGMGYYYMGGQTILHFKLIKIKQWRNVQFFFLLNCSFFFFLYFQLFSCFSFLFHFNLLNWIIIEFNKLPGMNGSSNTWHFMKISFYLDKTLFEKFYLYKNVKLMFAQNEMNFYCFASIFALKTFQCTKFALRIYQIHWKRLKFHVVTTATDTHE